MMKMLPNTLKTGFLHDEYSSGAEVGDGWYGCMVGWVAFSFNPSMVVAPPFDPPEQAGMQYHFDYSKERRFNFLPPEKPIFNNSPCSQSSWCSL
jgi:hypothetical protein